MRKFTFSLARMKDYKDQILDREKNTLGRMRGELNRMDAEIDEMHEDFKRLNGEMQDKTGLGITVSELQCFRLQLENLHLRMRELRIERKRMEQRVEKQVQIVVSASQDVASLDKLKERQWDEYRKELAKAEEQVIAEFVSARFVRERSMSRA